MNLHSMKRTKKEKKGEAKEMSVESPSAEDYPYGLSINLEKESLEKLGLDIDDFSIGGKADMICKAEITNLHESASERRTNASASLQITDMAVHIRANEKPKKLKDVLSLLKGEDE